MKALPTEEDIAAYAAKLDEGALSDKEPAGEAVVVEGQVEGTAVEEDASTAPVAESEDDDPSEEAGEEGKAVPYDRFKAINERMKAAEARNADFDAKGYEQYLTKKEHYNRLDSMDQELGVYFKANPEELHRLQTAMKEGKAPADDPAPEGMDEALWKRLRANEAGMQALRQEADSRKMAETNEAEVIQEQAKLNAEIDTFRSDAKFGKLVGDKAFMQQALDSSLVQNRPFNEVAMDLAKWVEANRTSAVAALATTAVKRKGAKVETGGGPSGTVKKPRAPIGSDEEKRQMYEKYGISPDD